MPMKKGNKEKKIYYSPKEWERICGIAAMLNMKTGTYIRWISVFGEIKKFDLTTSEKLMLAINRYGNNLNQIARMVNTTGGVRKADIEKLQADVSEMVEDVERYLKQLKYDLL